MVPHGLHRFLRLQTSPYSSYGASPYSRFGGCGSFRGHAEMGMGEYGGYGDIGMGMNGGVS